MKRFTMKRAAQMFDDWYWGDDLYQAVHTLCCRMGALVIQQIADEKPHLFIESNAKGGITGAWFYFGPFYFKWTFTKADRDEEDWASNKLDVRIDEEGEW